MPSSFEDLEIWQRAINLSLKVYQLTHEFPKTETYGLTDQVKRSVNSISANIAEGFGRYHYKDRKLFMYNARGSLYETKSHLLLAEKLFKLKHTQLEPVYQDITTLSIKLNNFIRTISPQ